MEPIEFALDVLSKCKPFWCQRGPGRSGTQQFDCLCADFLDGWREPV